MEAGGGGWRRGGGEEEEGRRVEFRVLGITFRVLGCYLGV